jgi:hypothetical protein
VDWWKDADGGEWEFGVGLVKSEFLNMQEIKIIRTSVCNTN